MVDDPKLPDESFLMISTYPKEDLVWIGEVDQIGEVSAIAIEGIKNVENIFQ